MSLCPVFDSSLSTLLSRERGNGGGGSSGDDGHDDGLHPATHHAIQCAYSRNVWTDAADVSVSFTNVVFVIYCSFLAAVG